MNDKQKAQLEEQIEELESVRGRHTELVTVLIPVDFNIHSVTKQLEAERSTADNIKSKQTRSAVTDAIDLIVRTLKATKKTPVNGLALYAGNISEKEGVQDMKLWAIEPPKPLRIRMYRCDQTFVTQPLKDMLQTDEIFGLVVIDRQEATIGLLEGKQIKVLRHLTSGVPSKVRAGGQCLSPDTLIETKEGKKKIKDLKIGEKIKALDIKNNKIIFTKCINKWNNLKENCLEIFTKDKKLICSGDHIIFIHNIQDNNLIEVFAENISPKAMVMNSNLKNEIISKINKINWKLELIDIETECKNFFANNLLVHNSSQRFARVTEGLAKEFFRRTSEAMKELFFDLPRLKGILVGGPIPTKDEFLEDGLLVTKLKEKVIAVKDIGYVDEHGLKLLVEASQEDIAEQEIIKEKKIVEEFFMTLGKYPEKTAYGEERTKTALERGAVYKLLISNKLAKSKIAEFEKMAIDMGTEVIMVSDETPEGEQFLNMTKGLGAILRFQIE